MLRAKDLVGARILGIGVALLAVTACGGDEGGGSTTLQSRCVIEQLGLERTLPDGTSCSNFGYSDCRGFGSECINTCAFDRCQAASCAGDSDCVATFGATYECKEYVVGGTSYGSWCDESDCPRGTLGCPCRADRSCDEDPFGSAPMTCGAGGACESACPSACRVGTSVCCGGSLCSGECIGTPCC